MKTPTLIVRLVGMYLIVCSTMNLIQIHQANVMATSGGFGADQQGVISNIQLYSVVGLVACLLATIFAGRLAKLLTLDSD